MKTYAIRVERELIQTHDFEIEAESEDEACELAELEASGLADNAWENALLEDPEITTIVELSDDDKTDEDEPAEQEAA
jgi:hypothetical protein